MSKEELEALKHKASELSSEDEDVEVGISNNLHPAEKKSKQAVAQPRKPVTFDHFEKKECDPNIARDLNLQKVKKE